MENNMTEISYQMYNRAVKDNLTVSQAVEMLKECTLFRTLSSKLGAFSKGQDLKKLLIDGLCENHPEMKRDTVSRKVRNWLNDCQNSIGKQDAIELCFILKLSYEESDSLVAMISQQSLHWRDPEEIPYIFALCKGMTYSQAVQLHHKIKAQTGKVPESQGEEAFTDVVKKEISAISDENELVEYVIKVKNRLGSLHNTAYDLFCEMMDKLEQPEYEDVNGYLPENEKYSVGRIVKSYMHRDSVPEIADNSVFSALQRSIARNWPAETALSRIRNRHTDVTRKVLILLFLATYDAEQTQEDYDDYFDADPDYEKSGDEIFEQFYKNMNLMLENCGFARLDPRSAFDWMVIFCMCVEDVWELDSTMTDFLNALYQDADTGNGLQN